MSLFKNRMFRYQLFALAAGVLLMLFKFVGYFLTNSNTILTDALESIVNILGGAFALYSIILSSKPKDADHPYGHGKVEFLSAGFEGVMIMLAGLLIIWKSAFNIFHPHNIEKIEIGVIIVVVSGLINFTIGWFLEHKGKYLNSVVLVADGKHLKTDAYSSLAILAGLLIIYLTGYAVLDNVIAILIGFYIVYSGYNIARRSLSGIMDEADENLIKAIIAYLNAHRKDYWIDIHNLRIIQYGSKLHVDCHVTLPWYLSLEDAHAEVSAIEKAVNDMHYEQVELFIHSDPCIVSSCKVCSISDCAQRKEVFSHRIEWDIMNLSANKKHGAA